MSGCPYSHKKLSNTLVELISNDIINTYILIHDDLNGLTGNAPNARISKIDLVPVAIFDLCKLLKSY